MPAAAHSGQKKHAGAPATAFHVCCRLHSNVTNGHSPQSTQGRGSPPMPFVCTEPRTTSPPSSGAQPKGRVPAGLHSADGIWLRCSLNERRDVVWQCSSAAYSMSKQ
eukprot:4919-Heterococcus_DN1.PRE.1